MNKAEIRIENRMWKVKNPCSPYEIVKDVILRGKSV